MKSFQSLIDNLRPGERRFTVFLLAIGIMAFTAAGVYAMRDHSAPIPEKGGVYHEGMIGEIPGLNSIDCYESLAAADVCPLVFTGLTRQDPETNITTGQIAWKWRISEDNKTYTFTIRDDAVFHDGVPVKAEDVVFTYKTLLQDEAYKGPAKALFQGVAIDAVDEHTVTFTLKKENAFFPESLSVGILPKHALEGVSAANLAGHEFSQSPIGAGPFTVIKISHSDNSDTVELEPVDQNTHIEKLVLTAYKESSDLLDNLSGLDGIKEVAGNFNPDEAAGWHSVPLRLPRYVGVFFNTDKKTLQSLNVRQALSMSIPRKEIVDIVGDAEMVWSPIPIFEQRNAIPQTEENIERSKKRAEELLIDAGWRVSTGVSGAVRTKDDKPLVINLATHRDPDLLAVAEKIRDAWKELGVNVNIVTPQTLADLESGVIANRGYDVLLVGITTDSNVDLYPNFHSSQIGYVLY